MTLLRGEIALPNRAEALGRIEDFIGVDAGAIGNHTELARQLSGLSLAYSSVALEYGEAHPVPGIATNIGMWTKIGEGANTHRFVMTPQDIFGLSGVEFERYAVEGGTEKYFDGAVVPTDKILEGFIAADPARLTNGWHMPSWTDVHATRVRTEGTERSRQEYWPFHMPLETLGDGQTSQERVTNYAQILQGLSKTLLEIIK